MHSQFAIIAAGLSLAVAAPCQMRQMPAAELRDRIEGGWAGQMIGVSFGAPTEFCINGKIIEADCRSGRRTACPTRSTRTTSTST